MKLLLGTLFTVLGYLVFYEHLLSDVVAVRLRGGRRSITVAEAERAINDHVVYNAERGFRRGANHHLILVPDGLEGAIRKMLRQQLPRAVWTKIGVVTITQIQNAIRRLESKDANG